MHTVESQSSWSIPRCLLWANFFVSDSIGFSVVDQRVLQEETGGAVDMGREKSISGGSSSG
jgi:hypothetical protein